MRTHENWLLNKIINSTKIKAKFSRENETIDKNEWANNTHWAFSVQRSGPKINSFEF